MINNIFFTNEAMGESMIKSEDRKFNDNLNNKLILSNLMNLLFNHIYASKIIIYSEYKD